MSQTRNPLPTSSAQAIDPHRSDDDLVLMLEDAGTAQPERARPFVSASLAMAGVFFFSLATFPFWPSLGDTGAAVSKQATLAVPVAPSSDATPSSDASRLHASPGMIAPVVTAPPVGPGRFKPAPQAANDPGL